jgi:hypothetical protein
MGEIQKPSHIIGAGYFELVGKGGTYKAQNES